MWGIYDVDGQPYTQGGAVLAEPTEADARLVLSLLPDAVIQPRPADRPEPTVSWVRHWRGRHEAWVAAQHHPVS